MTAGLVAGKSESGRGLPLPSASRMLIIRAGEEGVPGWVLPPAWAGDPLLPPAFGGASSSPAEEVSSSHAGEGKLLLPGQGAAVRPPPGRRSCRAQVAAVTGAGVGAAAGEASHRSGCLCRRDRRCQLRSGPPALWL
jgi:hypothetical protein